MSDDTKPSKVAIRYVGLDQIRGIGVLLMIIFHFCYDLMAYPFPSIPKDSTLFWYWLLLNCFYFSFFVLEFLSELPIIPLQNTNPFSSASLKSQEQPH